MPGETLRLLDYDLGMGFGSNNARARLGVVLALWLAAPEVLAQGTPEDTPPVASTAPPTAPAEAAAVANPASAAELAALYGKNLARIDVVFDEPLWASDVQLTRVRVGQTFTPEVARRALDELADSGGFGELSAEAEPLGGGVLLRLRVVARRAITAVRLTGVSDADEMLRAAELRAGQEVTARDLPRLRERLQEQLLRRGYPDARVRVELFETDDPMQVVLAFDVETGEAALVRERRFYVWPDPKAPGLGRLLASYGVDKGDRVDLDALDVASRELEQKLSSAGYFEARVEHEIERAGSGAKLQVRVYAGPRTLIRFEGHRHFDATELTQALDLENASDRTPAALADRIREFYEKRGFFDASVEAIDRAPAGAARRPLLLRVREGGMLRVVARDYPCLSGDRTPEEIGSEIDSFLSELPGGTLVDAVDPRSVDALFGPTAGAGHREPPVTLNPWSVYSPGVYDKALEHLADLYHSEGYLSATVGPVIPVRRTCDVRSPPGRCITRAPRVKPAVSCRYDAVGLPQPEPEPDPALACREDPARGVRCEPEVVLTIPIKLGPRSFIQSIEMAGNLTVPDEALLEAAELVVGSPVSQFEIERARRRLLDSYAEEGYAFADIETALDLSADRRRAVVRFVISERKPVRVSRIVVRGARITSESLIRRRIALEVGELYRRSLVRRTEERLATLGVFSGVTVGLEDPYVPASEKVVLVTVQERLPQRLDVKPGFSTGEGFRIGFEYSHVNLGGEAIQLTLRTQLGYLPDALIFEDDVRRKYRAANLGIEERLERRNTATIQFPEIGLGPLFRLSVEGVDARDNARDFGLTKDAGIVTLFFIPERRLSFQLGASLERNNTEIFDKDAVRQSSARNVIRVPDGQSIVIGQRVGATWDRRDNPFDATSGTFVSASVEHVQACPAQFPPACLDDPRRRPAPGESPDPFEAVPAWFLRYTNRVAGYVRLSKRGLALATSFRWGVNTQLTGNSRTYPDRLFFLGGVESLRGFLQDSMIPEDVAQRLRGGALAVEEVPIRGGNMFVNPRLELRIPLRDNVQTGLFLDTGNLWTRFCSWEVLPNGTLRRDAWDNCFRLRYSTGAGLRVGTPIGPLVFDYGFNIERVLDQLSLRSDDRPRYWEDIGAFHFGIGLF